jgi:hypothetical protein
MNLLCILSFIIKYRIIFLVTFPTAIRFSLYIRKSSELWLVHNPEPYVEVCVNDSTCSMPVCTFIMNFVINNQKFFEQIHLHTTQIQAISILFIDHMELHLVFMKCFLCWQQFSSSPPSVTVLKNDKTKFKAALRKYVHTHCFFCVDEYFMCKEDL